jgi:hypothetical protein
MYACIDVRRHSRETIACVVAVQQWTPRPADAGSRHFVTNILKEVKPMERLVEMYVFKELFINVVEGFGLRVSPGFQLWARYTRL